MKLGVCVPYRNRQEHLKEFIPAITNHLQKQDIDFNIYVAHQVDDKLFNRGAMKNIAAKHAFADGCDYIVWHDVDMIPEAGCDYSYPEEHPIHLATRISQMDYKLKYPDYFGGAVLFTKEQVERVNGYSNDYWDWGMEDDDLFWRCIYEGMVEVSYLKLDNKERNYIEFDGDSSYVKIETSDELRYLNSNSYTVSVLVNPEHIFDKNPIWMVGDKKKYWVEYPILRRGNWGVSFNNSRALTTLLWANGLEGVYQWYKRFENQWSWLTWTVDTRKSESRLYMNGEELSAERGEGNQSPKKWFGNLKRYGRKPYYLGVNPTAPDNEKFFKGKIADFKIWNRALTQDEIRNIHADYSTDGLLVDLDFSDESATDRSGNMNNGIVSDCKFGKSEINVYHSVLPFRREGRMNCLPHRDEGLVSDRRGNFKWAKGKTTAENERKLITNMQQKKHDYKKDGIEQIHYELVSIDDIADNAKMINVKL